MQAQRIRMKLTLTGSSSTGKTTLALELSKYRNLCVPEFVTADARTLLDEMNHHSMDQMTREQLREFQLLYLERKLAIEAQLSSLITERSTVDVAAYWLVRDGFDLPPITRDPYIEKCRIHALSYDLHVYLPFGVLPFVFDGYRSENLSFHKAIDNQIKTFLQDWGIHYITLDTTDLKSRVEIVIAALTRLT
jgi:nicotinamide riboside kinase